ncbi:hypothetical protein EPI10_011671 [Gossypium australe]|uniref:Uncharacterized protein n=1 Tax=Gossypium australe TaxID=47621 RepID=A0A5B6W7Z1_9ROSI|nr:hypothetical protein EPI10_011671 [Gossypium australe]
MPLFSELNPGILRTKIEAPQFELKPVMFQMLQTMGQFSGMLTEDPLLHLRLFMENPRSTGKEQCKTFTLRSKKVLELKVVEAKGELVVVQNQKEVQPEVETPIVCPRDPY